MWYRIFQNPQHYQLLTLILVLFLVKVPVIFFNVPVQEPDYLNPVSKSVDLWIRNLPLWLNMGLASVLLFVQALIINSFITRHQLAQRCGYYPALLVLILGSLFPEMSRLSPAALASLLDLWILFKLFRLPQTRHPLRVIFDTGFLISLSGLLYFPSIGLFAVLFYSLLVLRPTEVREWITAVIGLMLPWGLVYYILFLTDQHHTMTLLSHLFNPLYMRAEGLRPEEMHRLAFYTALPFILLGLWEWLKGFSQNVILVRKYYQVLMIWCLVVIGSALLSFKVHWVHFWPALPGLCFLGTLVLVQKKSFLPGLTITVLVVGLFLAQSVHLLVDLFP